MKTVYLGMSEMTSNDAHDVHSPQAGTKLLTEFARPTFDEWHAEVERLLKGAPFDKRMLTATHEGITLKPLYRREDAQHLRFDDAPPGFAPFVRGSRAVRPHDAAWEVAQEISYPTPDEFNRALSHDLERGLTAVNLPFDAAGCRGVDPDAAAAGEVGGDGVSVASADDLAAALDGVNLAVVPVYLHAGASGLAALAMLAAVAKKRRTPLSHLRGAVACDPLGEMLVRGGLSCPAVGALDELASMTEWAAANAPALGTVWVHGEIYNNAGANAVQELAFAVASGIEYLRCLEARGVAPRTAAAHLRFSCGLGANFFMEIAKLRAARLLWNRVLEASKVEVSARLFHLHARTSRYTQTVYDPYVNMLRGTTAAFSGAVGGADSIDVTPFDAAVRPMDEFSRRIARNTQLVIRDEAHLAQILDPAGGSWYVERLTNEVAIAAWTLVQTVEKQGGMLASIQSGFVQKESATTAAARDKAYASRKDVLVGTNQYANAGETPLDAPSVDPAQVQAARSRAVAAKRATPANEPELKKIGAASGSSLVSAVISAAATGATIGQITKVLPTRIGNGAAVTRLVAKRADQPFAALRKAVETHRKTKGGLEVFLATLGPARAYMPRLDFAASFFEVGGFPVKRTMGHDTPDAAAKAARESGARAAVICGLDETYAAQAADLAAMLKAVNPSTVVILAGYPVDEAFRTSLAKAGVDLFIHIRSNILETLVDLARRLGVQL